MFLHKSWDQMENAGVTAIADIDETRFPAGINCYKDWREILTDSNVDIVSLATPPSSHAELGCAIMEAGKHLLIEKPLATTIEDAEKLVTTRDKTGAVAAVNFMLRFNPLIELLVSWGHNGTFGKLRRAVVENYAQDETLPLDHWFWNPEVSGGILVEHSVHFLDLVDSIACAEIEYVDGARRKRNEQQEDQVMANVVYKNGLIASHYHEFARPNIYEQTSIRLLFDFAQLDIEGWIPLNGKVTALVNRQTEPELKKLPGFTEVSRVPLDQSKEYSCGGNTARLENLVTGLFGLREEKLDVYANCLRSMVGDMILKIENPGHQLRSPLDAGLETVRTAIRAHKAAVEHEKSN